MPFKWPDHSAKSNGGTEQVARRLESFLAEEHPDLLEFFNFHPSRLREYDGNKPSIYWCHDLASDPETYHLRDGGESKFDLMVFVSHWQFQQYQKDYNLDGYNCTVIPNSIINTDYDLYTNSSKWVNKLGTKNNPIRFVYHTTPHRGLELLVPAFIEVYQQLKEKDIHIELDVFSSFNVYGWGERDVMFEQLFEICKNQEGINYFGYKPNEEVRQHLLEKSHCYFYPSIWPETSCLSLIEAMSAGVYSIHSDYGCLAETAGGYTECYTFKKYPDDHKELIIQKMLDFCERVNTDSSLATYRSMAAGRANIVYSWDLIKNQWVKTLTALKNQLQVSQE